MDNDWSGQHTRLKFQMFGSSVVFYLLAKYQVDEMNLLGIFKFSKTPDNSKLSLVVLLFGIFSLVSFVLRSMNESSHWPSKHKDARLIAKSLVSDLPLVKQRVEELLSDGTVKIRKYGSLTETPLNDARLAFKEAEEILKGFRPLIGKNELQKQRISRLKEIMQEIRSGEHPDLDRLDSSWAEVYAIEGSLRHAVGQSSYIFPKDGVVTGQALNALNSSSTILDTLVEREVTYSKTVKNVSFSTFKRLCLIRIQNLVLAVGMPIVASITFLILGLISFGPSNQQWCI